MDRNPKGCASDMTVVHGSRRRQLCYRNCWRATLYNDCTEICSHQTRMLSVRKCFHAEGNACQAL